jgi:hypothetical protein
MSFWLSEMLGLVFICVFWVELGIILECREEGIL